MIDLTPLDVRKKRGDFGKGLRGYDPQEVDTFLELVAERMEVLVKENLAFRGTIDELEKKVGIQEGREQAIQDALVTAQELRQDVKKQARREAKLLEREAQGRIKAMIAESEKLLADHRTALKELERQRERFLKAFRTLLEREMDTVEVEFGRAPLEHVTLNFELGKGSWSIGEDEDEDEDDDQNSDDDDQEDSGHQNEQHDEQAKESPPVAESVTRKTKQRSTKADTRRPPGGKAGAVRSKAKQGATKAGDRRPSEGKEGDDSLWLSSIMTDRKDEDAK